MTNRLLRQLLRSAWPNPSIDRLLRAALLPDTAAAAAAWRDFDVSADFDHLTPGEMRLIGLVARRLEKLAPDSPMRARIGGIERANWSRSQLAIGEAGSGLRALAGAGIDMLVIKGASRAAAGDAGARGRMVNDVDIVVRPEAMERAFDILTRDGWLPAGSGSILYHRSRLADAVGINLVRGRFGNLDLHRTAFHPPYAAAGDDEDIWERSRPGQIGYVAVRVPSAGDAVAIALAHGALDAHKSSDWLADIATYVDAGVDWNLFERIVERHRLHAPASVALSYVRERLDRPVPEAMLDRLERIAGNHPVAFFAALAETRPKAKRIGLSWLSRAAAKQGRLFRTYRRRASPSRSPVILPMPFGARRRIPAGGKVFEQPLALPGHAAGEAWNGTVDLSIAVARPAASRRIEFEVNLPDRHLVRLRALLFGGRGGDRLLRFRFQIALPAGAGAPLLIAAPSRSFNSDAPEEVLDRYGARPFSLVDLRVERTAGRP